MAKLEVTVKNDEVVVYRKGATVTVRLDDKYDYMVAVNRSNSHGNTETIPLKRK